MRQLHHDVRSSKSQLPPGARRSRSSTRSRRWLPLILAFIPALSYGLCGLLAYLRFPGPFTPLDNTLSQLGSPILNPGGSTIYRVGCVLGGSATFAFFLCLTAWHRSGTQWQNLILLVVQGLGILAGLAMILFAVYPYDASRPHLVVLGILANSTLALMLLSLAALQRAGQPQRIRTIVTLLASGAILLMYVIPQAHWAEWIPAVLSQIYVWVLGYHTGIVAARSS